MSNEIKLGDLEFKAEDFNIPDDGVEWAKYGQARCHEIAYDANRILAEKLGKVRMTHDEKLAWANIFGQLCCAAIIFIAAWQATGSVSWAALILYALEDLKP